ncbi:MAG: 1-acylglycerol-3-phosphate O-acyltransferase [Geobacter sp.]|nr:1-acylglycerol-3-phosphate O-acyltransferase [Geobacter sp.]
MLRAYLFLVLFVPLTFLLAFSALIATLFDASGRAYHFHARLWSRISLRMAGARIETYGQELIPRGEPVIFMSNHQSNFDILALYQAIPERFSWIAKEELFNIPVFGHSMRRAGYIPLDRSDGRRSLRSMVAAAEHIRSGHSVVIFPEGTRTNDGDLLPFKMGGFLLTEKARVPIVPVTINGSGRINPAKEIRLKPGTISISFAEPISVQAQTGRKRDDLAEQVKAAINANLEH